MPFTDLDGWLAARAAIWVWDYESGFEIPWRAVQLARDSGALEVLAVADNVCGQAAVWAGDFELAALLVAEVEVVKEATGSRIGPYAAIALVGLNESPDQPRFSYARAVDYC